MLVIISRFLFCFTLTFPCHSDIITKAVSKVFSRLTWYGGRQQSLAIDKISCKFDKGITCVIGPSGAGKSTLAKCLANLESISSGNIKYMNSYKPYPCIYLNHLYTLSYDEKKFCNDYLKNPTTASKLVAGLMEVFGYPNFQDKRVVSLMESDRLAFEVLLSASRLDQLDSSILIVFDEYFDKKATSARLKIAKALKKLCSSAEMSAIVIILTHSRGVLRDFSSHTIVMKAGRIFDINDDHSKLVLPSQLSLID